MTPSVLPFLTPDTPGLGGRIKAEPEDFVVDEIPLYQPSGSGEHLYLWIEKRDLTGERLLDHLARGLGVSARDIGMAGLKDRRAVTRQFVSVPRSAESRLSAVDGAGVRILSARPHGNKLRTGHLAGNRFEVRIRDVDLTAAEALPALLHHLAEHGVPNFYGEQRFGLDGETLQLGERLLRGEQSERHIPPRRRRFLLRLALSAVQSELFNRVLAGRMQAGRLHRVEAGDVMQVLTSGGCFTVEDVAREQSRFLLRETVLTGPMFGPRMKSASGVPGEREAECLAASGLTLRDFGRFSKLLPGTRRPLLVWPRELTGERLTTDVRLTFTLPAGAYATTLLREVMKSTTAVEEALESAEQTE